MAPEKNRQILRLVRCLKKASHLSTESQFVFLPPDESESPSDGTEVVGVSDPSRAMRGKVEEKEERRAEEETLQNMPVGTKQKR